MVANTRKTSGAGPLRSVRPGIAKPGALTTENKAPGTVEQNPNFRSLNLPMPIEVVEDSAGRPAAIVLPRTIANRPVRSRRPAARQDHTPTPAWLAVTSISDLWQVDDEWWRERPISRRYYQIIMQNDRRLTIFQDQLNQSWYWQKGG